MPTLSPIPRRIFLVGPMGAGKSSVGRCLAKRLSYQFLDSDSAIVKDTGVSISTIFDIEGEAGFRQREAHCLARLADRDQAVIATGGGAVLLKQNRRLMRRRGCVILLTASVERQWRRTGHDPDRPLLQGPNPKAQLHALAQSRQALYHDVADWIIDTDPLAVAAITDHIHYRLTHPDTDPASPHVTPSLRLNIDLGARSYPIHIGSGLLGQPWLLGDYIDSRRVLVLTNTTVAPLYLQRLLAGLRDFDTETLTLADGEHTKSVDHWWSVMDTLVQGRYGRDTTLIALGGGVIGDLTGFAAASYQRGIPFIQVPTTLLAQVDSSVGGKTGINHPGGKNLVGAFHQPRCVIADIDTLQTLDRRQLSAGLAEVLKYGFIRLRDFLDWCAAHLTALTARDEATLAYAVEQSCRCKADMVTADEFEADQRALLNLGHTFGHAIENAQGYGQWLHGEAVACGISLAADLSHRMGWLTAADQTLADQLLRQAELPIDPPKIMDAAQFHRLMAIDKKVRDGKLRLVLLKALGNAVITSDVDHAMLHRMLSERLAG